MLFVLEGRFPLSAQSGRVSDSKVPVGQTGTLNCVSDRPGFLEKGWDEEEGWPWARFSGGEGGTVEIKKRKRIDDLQDT